jgi:signal transduction histidine kinase
VAGDPVWLGRVVANLVDNACKFTPPGGEVGVAVESDVAAVTVTVTDTGPGLSEEERTRVFERFYRGSGVRGSVAGFGLGLALAREIVRQSGGEIEVGSPGRGATFRVRLPAA